MKQNIDSLILTVVCITYKYESNINQHTTNTHIHYYIHAHNTCPQKGGAPSLKKCHGKSQRLQLSHKTSMIEEWNCLILTLVAKLQPNLFLSNDLLNPTTEEDAFISTWKKLYKTF